MTDDGSAPPIGTQLAENDDEFIPHKEIDSNTDGSHLNAWGILRKNDGTKEEIRLEYRMKDGNRDMYVLGRNAQMCDIVVEDDKRRISSQHCKIYVDYSQAMKVTVFLENMSINGTYLNHSHTKLAKGERMELRSGDEIFLIAPHHITTSTQTHCSFVFLNMRDRVVANRERSSAAAAAAAAPRANLMNPYLRLLQGDTPAPNPTPIPTPIPSAGRVFADHYILGDPLGCGMGGEVRLCTDRQTGRQCAVKILDVRKYEFLSGGNHGTSVQDLLAEAETMRRLRHPHIVAVYDVFHTSTLVHIVMELVQGGDLFDRLVTRGQYSESLARRVVRQILLAVEFIHAQNYLHRDLKPENVLLVSQEDDGWVKLTDFGLAKSLGADGGLRTYCGTPQYFAPEVLQRQQTVTGTGRYGKAADLWSVGVILFVLLSGAFPFDDDRLFHQIARAEFSFASEVWRGVSAEAKDLISALLAVRPELRLTASQALQHPWITQTTTTSNTTSNTTSSAAAKVKGAEQAPKNAQKHPTNAKKQSAADSLVLPALSFATKAPSTPSPLPPPPPPLTMTIPPATTGKTTGKQEPGPALAAAQDSDGEAQWRFSHLGPCGGAGGGGASSAAQEAELAEDGIEAYSSDTSTEEVEEKKKKAKRGAKTPGAGAGRGRRRKRPDEGEGEGAAPPHAKKNVTFAPAPAPPQQRQLSLDSLWRPPQPPASASAIAAASPDSHEGLVKLRSPVNTLSRVFTSQPLLKQSPS